jgi:hypothetical protein
MAQPVEPVVANLKDLAGSTEPFFFATQPTPPARLEYLVSLNLKVLGAAMTPYACTGLNTIAAEAAGTAWQAIQVFGPGTHAARVYATISWSNAVGTVADAQITNVVTNPAANDRIDIPSPSGNGGTLNQLTEGGATVVRGSDTYDNAPTADGTNRLVEITAALAPVVEEFSLDNLFGFTCRPNPVLDLSAI